MFGEAQFNFQIDPSAIPVFYITFNSWNERIYKVIYECLMHLRCYILIETHKSPTGLVELTIDTIADFLKWKPKIDYWVTD
jgi:hypothetical protein